MIYAKKGYEYIEMDLDTIVKNKVKLLKDIDNIPDKLHILNGNVLNYIDFNKCEKFLDKDREIAIINEELLRYLTFDEKEIVAKNIYNILKKYNGVWITSDVTPKKFIEKQDKCLTDFNNNLSKVTSRNELQDRFSNIDHIKTFMRKIGFKNIEVHRFIEVRDKLKSFEILGIEKEKYTELLENAIVAVIKI